MDSSQHRLSAILEDVYGVTPVSPLLKRIRLTGTTLALAKGNFVSEELRSDRQIADSRHGSKQIGGDIMTEMSYASHDDYLEAVLCGTWAVKAAPVTAVTISAQASDNSINFSANNAPLVEKGDRITIAGFTGTVGNNRAKALVVSRTVAKIVISGGVPLVDDAAGESVTVTTLTGKLSAGVTRRSFSMLRDFTDATADRYHLFKGLELNKFDLTVGVEGIVKVGYGIIGKTQDDPSDSEPDTTTYTDVNTNAVMDSFLGTVYEGGTLLAIATEIKMTLENGIAPKFVIGSDSTNKPSIGRSALTGQLTAFAEDAALLRKFINQTDSSLKFSLSDQAGNSYRFTFNRVKFNGGQMDTSGQGPVVVPLPFQALLSNAGEPNIIVERNAA